MGSALQVIAEPRRRAILRLVWDAERPAGEIAAQFPEVTHAAVSQHLKVLKEAGLVTERRDGRRRLYLAERDQVARIRQELESFWDSALDRLRQLVEADAKETRTDGR